MSQPRELVVLLHGLGRSSLSMWPMARRLAREGFEVLNWGYSSYRHPIAELGEQLQRDVEAARGSATRVHFVGHSLGSIIIRWALTRGTPPADVGRVVMLAPPNQGSRTADRYARWAGWLLKPLPELVTDARSTVRGLTVPPNIPIGIIAGARDGKVAVQETELEGAAAHVTVPAVHSFLMMRSDVQRMTLNFLRTGRFG